MHSHPPPERRRAATSSGAADREAAEQLAALVHAIRIPVAQVDERFRIQWVNLAFCAVAGEPAPSLRGRPFSDLLDDASGDWLAHRIGRGDHFRDGSAIGRVQLRASPGEAFLMSPVPATRDGRLIGWLVSLRPSGAGTLVDPTLGDVLAHETHQKQKLEALLTVSQMVTSSIEHEVVLNTIAREVRRVVQVDECTVFLLDEREQLLRPVACDVMDYHDEVMAVRLIPGQGITGSVFVSGVGEIVEDSENDPRAMTVPGTPAEESSLLCVPLVARRRVMGVITLARIGAQRRPFVQEDLEIASLFAGQCSAAIQNARIYEQLKKAFDELRHTQTQLVQSAKLNALGEMAGGVAHDFNNILAAILGRTQLLLRTLEDSSIRRQLQVIEQAALDGAHTVRRVQEFTRVRIDERFEPLDLNGVIESVLELTRPAWMTNAKKRGIAIHVHSRLSARQLVEGNASELREVFTNLVLNAVDALPWGGSLFVITEDAGDAVVARFRDTGVGMEEDTRLRVFDPFFTTKSVQGTGLGLSVAYGIVTRHRGTIEVESQRGVGTEFTVMLPATRAGGNHEEALLPAGPLQARSVLVVDDEPAVLDVLADMLRTLGQDVSVAVGGEAGCIAFDQQPAQIVFTDLGMPEVNGWDLADHIRQRSPDVGVVLVTGWGFQLEEDLALARGVDLILTKPFTLEDVERAFARVSSLVESRRAA